MTLFGFNFQPLLVSSGAAVAFLIIFAESCLVFFLPGDSFIFAAGILASQHLLNLWTLMFLMFVGAILGNSVGYWIGKAVGVKLFQSRKSPLFNQENLRKTEIFYDRHGGFTIFLARFIPVVRTFAPMVAGTAKMKYASFSFYNFIGAAIWVAGIELAGYYLGGRIPNIDHYILPIVIAIVILSVLPGVFAMLKVRSRKEG